MISSKCSAMINTKSEQHFPETNMRPLHFESLKFWSLGHLRKVGIPVFMVSGNHNAASQITRALNLPNNVTLFSHKKPETRILDQLGVAIHGH
jgi:DNA repair exonuclease SbcCD nuclease subunit